MGSCINKIISFVRNVSNGANVSDVQVNDGGSTVTAQHFSAPGDDSFPLKTDYGLTSDVARSGSKAIHGYIDPINDPVAQEGDKRSYGRNPSNGTPVNQVWLKNDGSVLISNDNGSVLLRPDGGSIVTTPNNTFDVNADGSIKGANGSGFFELKASGVVDINNALIDPIGNITTQGIITSEVSVSAPLIAATGPNGSLTVQDKEMNEHTHSQGNDSNNDSQVNTNGPV